MSPSLVHGLFEALAWIAAAAIGLWVRRRYPQAAARAFGVRAYPLYLLVLWLGAVGGAYALGTVNLKLAGISADGRSILGAILGGVIVAEIYKALAGIKGSTGFVFVLPLAVAIAIGRIGCFAAGLPDYTYGMPTTLPWAVDFGDGIARHPVQLYEAIAMGAFALWFDLWLKRRPDAAAAWGFYVFVAFYAAQRFLWEFLKPYPTVLGPLNVFHLACLGLVIYALAMLRRARGIHAVA